MKRVQSVCVYCGSNPGKETLYTAAAEELGRQFALNGVRLIYGGGGLGLMGVVARSVLEHGGVVKGIIPRFLVEKESMLIDVQDHVITEDMHTRKRLMFDEADAFIALPGGIGTLEELVEQLTWAQLGQHAKPVLLANIGGFWSPLLSLLEHMRHEGFIRPHMPVMHLVADRVSDILPMLEAAAARAQREPEPDELPEQEVVQRM